MDWLRTGLFWTRFDKRQIALGAVLLLAIVLAWAGLAKQDVVGENVYVLGVPVGGLPKDEAEAAVEIAARKMEEGPFVFVAGDLSVEVDGPEMRLLLDDSQAIRNLDAYVSSRSKCLPSFFFRLGAKTVVAAPARVTSPDADDVLSAIAEALTLMPVAARYEFEGKDLRVLPFVPGQFVSIQDVQGALHAINGNFIEVSFRETSAPDDDCPTLELIGEYETDYDIEDHDRNVNLEIASRAVHGKVLEPGEVYSFNAEAGERTLEKGYRYANVVVDDHLEPGVAGGICQVTTTLFNAAARAGLDFPEVHAHGITVDYVPPGQDAAVAWGYLDIKIMNGTGSRIAFGSWVSDGKVTVRVYGAPSAMTYELLGVILEEYPEPGKEPGLLVETYRVGKKDGVEVERILLVRSWYLPHVPLSTKR